MKLDNKTKNTVRADMTNENTATVYMKYFYKRNTKIKIIFMIHVV